MEHFDNNRCLVVEGAYDKFIDLISLEDIEQRLNDGSNFSLAPQVIEGGQRRALVESSTAWAPSSLKKTEFSAAIDSGLSFMMPNSSQISPKIAQLTNQLEEFFLPKTMHADVHLYISTNDQGNSYNAHRDYPQHKILLQAIGEAHWTIYQTKEDIADNVVAVDEKSEHELLEPMTEFTLTQGDLLYMPPATFHKVDSVDGSRVSISIPFYASERAKKMDRSFIPFVDMFNAGLEK